jgi:hypothetical protein
VAFTCFCTNTAIRNALCHPPHLWLNHGVGRNSEDFKFRPQLVTLQMKPLLLLFLLLLSSSLLMLLCGR